MSHTLHPAASRSEHAPTLLERPWRSSSAQAVAADRKVRPRHRVRRGVPPAWMPRSAQQPVIKSVTVGPWLAWMRPLNSWMANGSTNVMEVKAS